MIWWKLQHISIWDIDEYSLVGFVLVRLDTQRDGGWTPMEDHYYLKKNSLNWIKKRGFFENFSLQVLEIIMKKVWLDLF